jgi:hypothetical protein
MEGLLNKLKFVHKMSADILKFVCSSAELVHKMRKLKLHSFLQHFRSGGCPFIFFLTDITVVIVVIIDIYHFYQGAGIAQSV